MRSDEYLDHRSSHPPVRRSAASLSSAIACLLLVGPVVGTALGDDLDRQMTFVEKTLQATELYNENRLAEALTAFQEIERRYADLDEDGYVAMSVADCLSALGRVEEARSAYESAWAVYPELQSAITYRLRELDIAGAVTDALIYELRQAVAAGGDSRFAASWQLGRALQKRARSLLEEAAAAFRGAVDPESMRSIPLDRMVTNHAAMLDELQEDLASLVERMETSWSALRRLAEMPDCGTQAASGGDHATEGYRAEWTVRAPGGRLLTVQAEGDMKSGQVRYTLNGQPIGLNRTQALLIQRHQERINAILVEAASSGAPAATENR